MASETAWGRGAEYIGAALCLSCCHRHGGAQDRQSCVQVNKTLCAWRMCFFAASKSLVLGSELVIDAEKS